jgi:hypothetical protein
VTIGGGGITTITVLVGGCGAGGVTVATVCVAGGETGGLITVLAEVFVGGGVKAVFWMTELEVIFGFGGAVPLPVDLLVLAAGGWLDVFGQVFGTTGGVMEAITGIGLLATGRGKGGGGVSTAFFAGVFAAIGPGPAGLRSCHQCQKNQAEHPNTTTSAAPISREAVAL